MTPTPREASITSQQKRQGTGVTLPLRLGLAGGKGLCQRHAPRTQLLLSSVVGVGAGIELGLGLGLGLTPGTLRLEAPLAHVHLVKPRFPPSRNCLFISTSIMVPQVTWKPHPSGWMCGLTAFSDDHKAVLETESQKNPVPILPWRRYYPSPKRTSRPRTTT